MSEPVLTPTRPKATHEREPTSPLPGHTRDPEPTPEPDLVLTTRMPDESDPDDKLVAPRLAENVDELPFEVLQWWPAKSLPELHRYIVNELRERAERIDDRRDRLTYRLKEQQALMEAGAANDETQISIAVLTAESKQTQEELQVSGIDSRIDSASPAGRLHGAHHSRAGQGGTRTIWLTAARAPRDQRLSQ